MISENIDRQNGNFSLKKVSLKKKKAAGSHASCSYAVRGRAHVSVFASERVSC